MNKKSIVLVIVLLLILLLGGYYLSNTLMKNKAGYGSDNNGQQTGNLEATEVVIPTKTKQQIQVISNIQDHIVKIENSAFNPGNLTIKAFDQVIWENNDNTGHTITGDNWGGVLINPGERFIQAFEETGTYNYTTEDNPAMKGTIIVE